MECFAVCSGMASEEQVWRNAAQTVLKETQGALHYLDIKRMILEKGLVGPGLQTTLESVLFKDVTLPVLLNEKKHTCYFNGIGQ